MFFDIVAQALLFDQYKRGKSVRNANDYIVRRARIAGNLGYIFLILIVRRVQQING